MTEYLSAFHHDYSVQVLEELPPGEASVFYFPGGSKKGGRDGLLLSIKPDKGQEWVGVFAFGGFGGGQTCISSTPDANTLCVVSSGAAYLVRAGDPSLNSQLPVVPVTDFRPLPERGVIIVADYTTIGALGGGGLLWRTGRLSWDGISITHVGPDFLEGEGWDPTTSTRPPFKVDLRTGEHSGGSSPKKYDSTRQVVR
jgi:hypothetical protein